MWYNAGDKGITARFFRESGTLKTLSEAKREGLFEECYRNLGAQYRRRTIGYTPKNREARRRTANIPEHNFNNNFIGGNFNEEQF